jgi:hypothetical protein
VKRSIISAVASAYLIPSVGFADNEIAPEFLSFGRPFSERSEKLSARELQRYERALGKFQRVDDCVEKTEATLDFVLSQMRWNELNTLEKVNLCVFRLAAELNSYERMLRWFNSNGFKAISTEVPQSVMRFYRHDNDGILVSAGAPIDGPIRVGLLDRLLAHSVSVGVTLTSDGKPLGVNTTITRK